MRCGWLLLLFATTAYADEQRPQLQVDGGLSVIGPAFEHPITDHIAVQVEAFIFGTYFLPWFDAGDKVRGFGGGVRPTWFAIPSGRGFYVAPYFRVVGVDDEDLSPSGIGFTTGVFAGWALRVRENVDIRVGAGAQYIHFHYDDAMGERGSTSTPFLALDAVLGYRL